MNDERILWSVFMTGSKTPGMSDTRDVIDFTVSDNFFQLLFLVKN